MGADFVDDIKAVEELRALSRAAKGWLQHHINNSLQVIVHALEEGDKKMGMEAVHHIVADLQKIQGERR